MRYGRIPYHKVVAARLQRSKERRNALHANRYSEIDRFMLTYEQAYHSYYGLPIVVTYKHGWYYINGARYRHGIIEQMTETLMAKVQAEQCPPID